MLEPGLFELLEGTSDAAFAVSDRGEICSWNKGAEKLFGYSGSEALNRSFRNLLQGRLRVERGFLPAPFMSGGVNPLKEPSPTSSISHTSRFFRQRQ